MLHPFVREMYISSIPPTPTIWHNGFGSPPRTWNTFSSSCAKNYSVHPLFLVAPTLFVSMLYFARGKKGPVSRICSGCQGLGEMCFQLLLGKMMDGGTIEQEKSSSVCMFAYSVVTMFVCVQTSLLMFDFAHEDSYWNNVEVSYSFLISELRTLPD